MNLLNDLKLEEEKAVKEIEQTEDLKHLERIRVSFLGRKGSVTNLVRELKDLSPGERPVAGKLANQIKDKIGALLAQRLDELKMGKGEGELRKKFLDYTLPGRKPWLGKLHPITQTLDQITEIFYGMGFEVAKGPDVETDYYNFKALNFPEDHPAMDMQDTFYISDHILLRTHTSPVQIREFEKRKPPVKIIAPGRTYRHEAINSRSYCVFHQVEGFYVDNDVTFADLKGILYTFVWEFFGKDVKLRFRASFFPFTEPSAEVDISCVICGGKGCSVCKHRGWLEILGAGMIDPEVFKAVGYDPEIYSGYAFGMGVERIALLKYRIDDVRLFYENDLRFLRQF
ncbi:MAG: phenylalanine--tRNA ligase subunit alpha [Candidatus Zixiibacteriota bacterium]